MALLVRRLSVREQLFTVPTRHRHTVVRPFDDDSTLAVKARTGLGSY